MIKDWNVVITVHEHGYKSARKVLEELGPVSKTDYLNVLVMKVEDTNRLLEDLLAYISADPTILDKLARLLPVSTSFNFQTPQEFEDKAREVVTPLVPLLAGKSFHVRMHRRGFKGRLSSQHEERFVDHFLMERLSEQGQEARITFDDPDVIIALDSVGQRAGISLWTRQQIQRYPFLKLD